MFNPFFLFHTLDYIILGVFFFLLCHYHKHYNRTESGALVNRLGPSLSPA